MIEAMSCPLFRFVVHASAAGTGGDSALSLMAGYEHPSDQVGKRENVSVSVEVLVAERALGAAAAAAGWSCPFVVGFAVIGRGMSDELVVLSMQALACAAKACQGG